MTTMKFLIPVISVALLFVSTAVSAKERSFDFAKLAPKLVEAKGEKATLNLKGKKFILVYYSSHWCSACRAFTTKLVEFYNKNHQELFEVLFMSLDFSEKDQLKYMRDMKMPWPAVKFSYLKPSGLFEYAGCVMPWISVFRADGTLVPNGCLHLINSSPAQVFAHLKKLMTDDNPCKSCCTAVTNKTNDD